MSNMDFTVERTFKMFNGLLYYIPHNFQNYNNNNFNYY